MDKIVKDEDLKLLIKYVSNFYYMLGIPVTVFRASEIIANFSVAPSNCSIVDYVDQLKFESIRNAKQSFVGNFAPNLLFFGVAYRKSDNTAVFLGPIKTDGISITLLKNNLDDPSAQFSSYKDDLLNYLTTLPVVNENRFRGFFSMIDMFLNKEYKDFSLKVQKKDLQSIVQEEEINYMELAEYREFDSNHAYEHEQRILFYVKNGMVDKIDELLKDAPLCLGTMANAPIRRLKDNVIMGIGLVSRLAMDAGVNGNLCLHMVNIFTDSAEGCYNLKQLGEVRYQSMRFFTEKINELHATNITNPIILRIMQYIIANVDKQISCKEISETFNINRSYVSTCFKKETGMGIVDYVNLQKVLRAKQLLKFSDESLAKITYQLGFSSQAYFTKIFKDIVGMTPLEYRES